MKNKLSVCFIWHMHQPLYKDLLSGRYHLPWVRLHSTCSYLDMITVMEEFPEISCTFNLSPSLLWQLDDISSSGRVKDRFLELSIKPAGDLTPEEKIFILKNFFSCHMPGDEGFHKRYKLLLYRRGPKVDDDTLLRASRDFTEQDLLDLQTYFNLAWCGFTLREREGICKELISKGSGFTEKEKKELLDLQARTVGEIIPLYRKKQQEKQIEISTTPYYHPILPLIAGRVGHDDFTQDADAHVRKAAEYYNELFGSYPKGMWPAEGAVSPEAMELLASRGIEWAASCEGILRESLKGDYDPGAVYDIYDVKTASGNIDMLFRNEGLSNAISFNYSGMPAEKAVEDLTGAFIRSISSLPEGSSPTASIIMDGENPWPYFPSMGADFLRCLYGRLSSSDEMATSTVSARLKEVPSRRELTELHSGSWIRRDFSKWYGSKQKSRAWEELRKARAQASESAEISGALKEEIMIAQSSDWFWWYDEFSGPMDLQFDTLFRMHLKNIYELSGNKVPAHLEEPFAESIETVSLSDGPAGGEMARPLRVLFVTSECVPFAKTGGLADVSAALPKALLELGIEIRVIMPFYPSVLESGNNVDMEERLKAPFKTGLMGFDLYSTFNGQVKTYFVGKKRYFKRKGIYGTSRGDYADNAYRFSFFCKSVLSVIEELGFKCDIIHCNDWQSALVPFYLRHIVRGKCFENIKTLFTIHNMGYQGIFSEKVLKKCGIPQKFFNMHDLEFYGKVNFMKSGILYSDAVSTVSERYAKEITTPEYGAGLEGVVRSRAEELHGIINGVDYSVWSPDKDMYIKEKFSSDFLKGKRECKKDLIARCGLKIKPGAPIIGSVGRLAEQKGMDLLANAAGSIVQLGCGMVILGSGSEGYNRMFEDLAAQFPEKIFVSTGFDDELAHKIEAGSDMFVMPSRYEPCGLNHMYSLRYGTIPIVRRTGGLDDVVTDYDLSSDGSNGFSFRAASSEELLRAIERAVDLYKNKKAWEELMRRAMKMDFSWQSSALRYERLYRHLVS